MTITAEDLWDDVPAKPSLKAASYGLDESRGRYMYPPPPGFEHLASGRGWMRMTNLVSAFSDQKALQEWMEWKAFMGLRVSDGLLFDEWMVERVELLEPAAQRELAKKYGEAARQAAGADEAGRRGTARHTMMHNYLTTGYESGTRSMRRQQAAAMAALDRHGFDVMDSEFRVWHPAAGGTMGTSDVKVLCRHTGQIGILDWKTQARFWTIQEIAGQLYGYDSALYVWRGPGTDEGYWEAATKGGMAPTLLGHPDGRFPGQRVALVAHMPLAAAQQGSGQELVTLEEVSLEYGKAVLETAARNVELRSVGRSESASRRPMARRPV